MLRSRRLVELDVVAFGVLEGCDASPGVFGDAGGDIDALVLQVVQGLLQAGFGLEGHDGAAFDAGAFGLAAVQADGKVVGVELLAISFIRYRYFDMSFVLSAVQVILGGALVFAAGILIGSA